MSIEYVLTIEQTLREILGLTDEEIEEIMTELFE